MALPHVPSFGGGVCLTGAPDQASTDELLIADGYDIGSRGALIAARSVSDYLTINDLGNVPAPWTKLHALRVIAGLNYAKEIAIGEGKVVATARFLLGAFTRENQATPLSGPTDVISFPAPILYGGGAGAVPAPPTESVVVTVAQFPGTYLLFDAGSAANQYVNVFLVNLGAREGFGVADGAGLYVVYAIPNATTVVVFAISEYDALGTGPLGSLTTGGFGGGGNKSRQLYGRGVAAYNGFAMLWGYDKSDPQLEGPARLMFSNLANPLVWGNDNQDTANHNRDFTDSDAIPIGDKGEIIRAGLTWNKRFWIGTDQKLHFLAGYGRDSFLTDGANPVADAENVIGPHCLIEGPDKLLYGVGDNGLWAFDGERFTRHHVRLRDFNGASAGWWDLIWNDVTRSNAYPGKTNADLVWMIVDWDFEQVIVGIPWCNATAGAGYGTDTVLVKFHPRTGGFTRQVFSGVVYTAADALRRQRQTAAVRFTGTATAGQATVKKMVTSMPTPLPRAKLGSYALYGPDSEGVYRRGYMTLGWGLGGSGAAPWTLRTAPQISLWLDICWSPDLNLFCAVAEEDAGTHHVMTSPDGINWTVRVTTNNQYTCVCWSHEQGMFVALASTDDVYMNSVDGITWNEAALPVSGNQWQRVTWGAAAGLFVGIAAISNDVLTSPDGSTWTLHAAALPYLNASFSDICWSQALAKYLTVSGANAATSANGIAWVSHAPPVGTQWAGCCWSPDLNLFCLVGSGLVNSAATSPDGVAWTPRTGATAIQWNAVIWAHTSGVFMAVGATAAGFGAMFSPDGVAWTPMAVPGTYGWERVAYSDSIPRFAAVQGGEGDAHSIMTLDSSSIPSTTLKFLITPIVDDRPRTPFTLWISNADPGGAASDGDVWLNTAAPATRYNSNPGATVNLHSRGVWVSQYRGGQGAQRATIPLPFDTSVGTRFELDVQCLQGDVRYQLEGWGWQVAEGAPE